VNEEGMRRPWEVGKWPNGFKKTCDKHGEIED
jgi:hypothetical protein